jgi:hypothetical protein
MQDVIRSAFDDPEAGEIVVVALLYRAPVGLAAM